MGRKAQLFCPLPIFPSQNILLPFATYDDLARAQAKGFPIVAAIDRLDGEAAGQEEQL